jgi:hypothetical protein
VGRCQNPQLTDDVDISGSGKGGGSARKRYISRSCSRPPPSQVRRSKSTPENWT